MDIAINHAQGICVVQARGRIDTLTAKPFGDQLVGLIQGGSHRLVIDLAQVAYISSAGFRSLLVAAKRMESLEGRLALSGVNGEVRRLFEIAALLDLFLIWSTADEAVQHLAQLPDAAA